MPNSLERGGGQLEMVLGVWPWCSGAWHCLSLGSGILERAHIWEGDGRMMSHFVYAELQVTVCTVLLGVWVWSQERGHTWESLFSISEESKGKGIGKGS